MPHSEEDKRAIEWVLDESRLNVVLDSVEKDLFAYHKVLQHTRCQSVALEEIFARGFSKAKINYDWTPQSHRKGSDFYVTRWGVRRAGISMKSGMRKPFDGRPGALKFSGGRHGTHRNNFAGMHRALLENSPSLYIMGANPLGGGAKYAHVAAYSIFAFPGELINYGEASDWTLAPNNRDFVYSGNGIQARISQATTNQVWTTVDLAALGIQPVRQILVTNKQMEAAAKLRRGKSRPATDEDIAHKMRWGTLAQANTAGPRQMALPLNLP